MTIARAAALLAVATALAVASPALAQPSKADLEKAKRHYQQGETHYNLGEFDRAIAEYKKAYALTKSPAFLFNIAQAYRLKKDYAQALYFYRTYLRVQPEARNRADVEERIAEMKQNVAAMKDRPIAPDASGGEEPPDDAGKTPPPDDPDGDDDTPPDDGDRPPTDVAANTAGNEMPPVIEPMTDPASDDDVARPGRGLRIAGISTGVAGLALIGTAAAFTSRARSDWADIEEIIDAGGQWSEPLHDKWRSAEDDERNAAIMYAVGGSAVIAGGVLWFLGHRQGKEATRVSAAPTPGGTRVLVTWSF